MAEEEAMPVVPLGDRKLRACLATGLIKTEEQWFKDGCAAARENLRAARRPPTAHARARENLRGRPPLTPAAHAHLSAPQPRHLRVHPDGGGPRCGARVHVAQL